MSSMSPAAANLQAFLAASVAFPGLLSHPGSAGLLAGLPAGFQSALAMQGLQGLFGAGASLPHPIPAPGSGGIPTKTAMSPPAASPSGVMDFSAKRPSIKEEKTQADEDDALPVKRKAGESTTPLDLSAGVRKRERSSSSSGGGPAEKRSSSSGQHHKSETWNGHNNNKSSFIAPPDASKALERMTELSRLTGEPRGGAGTGGSNGGRQSAWQSHWLSKGADTAKDVLKCVWCKLSFDSLAALTTHMKESKHCGVNASLMSSSSASSVNSSPITTSTSSNTTTTTSASPSLQRSSPSAHPSANASQPSHPPHPSATSTSSSSGKAHTNHDLLLKESGGQVQLPRKLVRGQDVWLGKGAEQTRQILKCMWCGQSFRSLAEMTTHMQQTQHYTNIISQEQIISWKAADGDSGSSGEGRSKNSSSHHHNAHPPSAPSNQHQQQQQQQQQQSHVNAVLTCKVCDQAFSSLKELSSHMVKNSHYKEHIMRSISDNGGRRRQARDKRKKALPVRKLLELERAQQEARSHQQQQLAHQQQSSASGSSGRISCEKCGDKIETGNFVEHIRQCVGGGMRSKSSTPSPLTSSGSNKPDGGVQNGKTSKKVAAAEPSPSRASPASAGSANGSDHHSPAAQPPSVDASGNPSVLNAIEKLIEKSFDAGQGGNKAAKGSAVGSNILRRLGIDESLDYSKPLMDPLMTVNMLRLYGYGGAAGGQHPLTGQQQHHRERTTSEASSSATSAVQNGSDHGGNQQRDSGKSTPRSVVSNGQHSRSPSQSPRAVNRHYARNKDLSPLPPQSPDAPKMEASASPAPSPVSERSSTQLSSPRSQSQTPDVPMPPRSSLNALSSMFEGLVPTSTASGNGGGTGGGNGGGNPLAALQKLCDKTETHSPNSRPSSIGASNSSTPAAGNGPSTSSSSGGVTSTNPGAILAFSWACNDAVMTDSIMKCAFCDTQFISKGAYRHHLSKMHFVKDAAAPTVTSTPKVSSSSSSSSGKGSGSAPAAGTSSSSPQPPPASSSATATSSGSSFEESPHSKFLKYTELAKQLSSKYV